MIVILVQYISQLTIKILIFILFSHYPFPKHLRTLGFTFYTYIHTLTLPYTNILTSHTDIYSFYLSHFQFEVVKSKKGWNTGNKSYCYGSVSYHKHDSSPIKCYISRRQWKCIMYLSKLATHISKWWNVGSKNSYCPMIENFGGIRLTKL